LSFRSYTGYVKSLDKEKSYIYFEEIEMDTEMTLEQPQLEQIGRYVKTHIAEWISEIPTRYTRDFEIELRERTVRVEEELKSQREIIVQVLNQMDKRFEQVDKRFEQVDKHFEQVDKRFEQIDKRFEQVDKRFELVDKRFEQINERFEDVNKRFTMLMWSIGIGFTLITVTFSMVAAFLKH
jgi:hypothetical protein